MPLPPYLSLSLSLSPLSPPTTYRPARHEEHERRRFEISPFSAAAAAEAMKGRALRINNHLSGSTFVPELS